MTIDTTKTRQELVAKVSPAELHDIQSGLMAVPVRSNNWRDDQTIPLYLAAPVAQQSEAVAVELQGVAEELAQDSGFWRSCSGCYETVDGHAVGYYPYSHVFKCALGSGCSECGGLGAVWDSTDYAELALDWTAGEHDSAQPVEAGAPTAPASHPQFDASKALYWFSILLKCSHLLGLEEDEPIPSGVLAAVEKLVTGRVSAAPGAEQDARDAERFRWIENNCRTTGGGHGFTLTCYVQVDEEDIGVAIDAAMQKGAQ